ncbi:MAG: TetR/AcrR family transcriptional regulator [Roseiflexaceae bacterium]|nr:TetR/AcrR family transcriptional regulator [Roseiflexaceae bacterium]
MQPYQETLGPTAIRIMGTARQLFMQRGYKAVSISDIVRAAEITKPTLYYHFADKEELFVQMVLHMLDAMRAEMDAVIATQRDTYGKLSVLVQMMMSKPDLDSRMVRQEAREHLSPAQQQRVGVAFEQSMFKPLCLVMRQGIEQGELIGYAAEELAMLFLCCLEGFHFQNEKGSPMTPEGPDSAFASITFPPETIVKIFLHGVGSKPTSRG